MGFRNKYKSGLLGMVLMILINPALAQADCRVIEYADRNEVVCEDETEPKPGQTPGQKSPKLDTTTQREFMFYSPVMAGSKILLAGDLTQHAIATSGDLLFSYRFDELRNRGYIASTVSFTFVERNGDNSFTVRMEGNGPLVTAGQKDINVDFNVKKDFPLLLPFNAGCSSAGSDNVYLRMYRLEGTQLYYRIVLPPCLAGLVENSLPD